MNVCFLNGVQLFETYLQDFTIVYNTQNTAFSYGVSSMRADFSFCQIASEHTMGNAILFYSHSQSIFLKLLHLQLFFKKWLRY